MSPPSSAIEPNPGSKRRTRTVGSARLEFDQRIGQVLSAVSRKDLNEAFYGLVQVPTPSRALGVHPAYQPLVRPETRQQAGRGVAGFAHFSFFFMWLFGPGLVFALSSPGTYARREAAKAFNFQLISTIAFFTMVIIGGITGQRSGRRTCSDCSRWAGSS